MPGPLCCGMMVVIECFADEWGIRQNIAIAAKYGTIIDFLFFVIFLLTGLVMGTCQGVRHGLGGALVGGLCGIVIGFLFFMALGAMLTGIQWLVNRIRWRHD